MYVYIEFSVSLRNGHCSEFRPSCTKACILYAIEIPRQIQSIFKCASASWAMRAVRTNHDSVSHLSSYGYATVHSIYRYRKSSGTTVQTRDTRYEILAELSQLVRSDSFKTTEKLLRFNEHVDDFDFQRFHQRPHVSFLIVPCNFILNCYKITSHWLHTIGFVFNFYTIFGSWKIDQIKYYRSVIYVFDYRAMFSWMN